MSTSIVDRLGGVERVRDGATWLLVFVGAVASVAGLAGRLDFLRSGSLLPAGGAAVVVLVLTTGAVVLRSARLDPDDGGRPDTAAALALYQAEGCPHCAKVRRFCTRHGIDLTLYNPRTAGSAFTGGTVTNRDRHDELTGYGQDQVPLLVDRERGESRYESDDIVAYLDEHYA
jgi:glutaredoxin